MTVSNAASLVGFVTLRSGGRMRAGGDPHSRTRMRDSSTIQSRPSSGESASDRRNRAPHADPPRQRYHPFSRQLRCVTHRGLNGLVGNRRVALRDLLRAQTGCEVVEDRAHEHSSVRDAGPPVADFRIDGNVFSPVHDVLPRILPVSLGMLDCRRLRCRSRRSPAITTQFARAPELAEAVPVQPSLQSRPVQSLEPRTPRSPSRRPRCSTDGPSGHRRACASGS